MISVGYRDQRADEGGGETGGCEEEHLAREPYCLEALHLEDNIELPRINGIGAELTDPTIHCCTYMMVTVANSCLVVQVDVQTSHHKMMQTDEVGGNGVGGLGQDATEGPQSSRAHLDRLVRKRNSKAKIAKHKIQFNKLIHLALNCSPQHDFFYTKAVRCFCSCFFCALSFRRQPRFVSLPPSPLPHLRQSIQIGHRHRLGSRPIRCGLQERP